MHSTGDTARDLVRPRRPASSGVHASRVTAFSVPGVGRSCVGHLVAQPSRRTKTLPAFPFRRGPIPTPRNCQRSGKAVWKFPKNGFAIRNSHVQTDPSHRNIPLARQVPPEKAEPPAAASGGLWPVEVQHCPEVWWIWMAGCQPRLPASSRNLATASSLSYTGPFLLSGRATATLQEVDLYPKLKWLILTVHSPARILVRNHPQSSTVWRNWPELRVLPIQHVVGVFLPLNARDTNRVFSPPFLSYFSGSRVAAGEVDSLRSSRIC
jgi:hypothetical protein